MSTGMPIPARPWDHFPHCPACHRRLHSTARNLTPPTPAGRCPYCDTDLYAPTERAAP